MAADAGHEAERGQTHSSAVGRKDDGGKDPWDLVPWEALEQVVLVLEHGRKKYGPWNWTQVPQPRRRYFAAMVRHLVAWRKGQRLDPETNLPHLAHAICCALFLLTKEMPEASESFE